MKTRTPPSPLMVAATALSLLTLAASSATSQDLPPDLGDPCGSAPCPHSHAYVAAVDDTVVLPAGDITPAATALLDITDTTFPLVSATYCQDLDDDDDCEPGTADNVAPFCDSITLLGGTNWDPGEAVLVVLDTAALGGDNCGSSLANSFATVGTLVHT